MELVDNSLDMGLCAEEACKYLKIALLCIQGSPTLRPTMSSVIKMLTGEMDVSNKITKPDLSLDSPRIYPCFELDLETEWEDLLSAKMALELEKSAVIAEKEKLGTIMEKLVYNSFWNGVDQVRHFYGVELDYDLLNPHKVVGEEGLVDPKGSSADA